MGFSLNKNVFECVLNQASEVWIDTLIFDSPVWEDQTIMIATLIFARQFWRANNMLLLF